MEHCIEIWAQHRHFLAVANIPPLRSRFPHLENEGVHLLHSKCSAKEGSLPSPPPSAPACREAGVRDRGKGSYPVSVSRPSCSLPLSDPGISWGEREGVGSVCVCLRGGMGCPASRAEDDSLGCGPGTLGKARPASGQSPRELRGREEGAGTA